MEGPRGGEVDRSHSSVTFPGCPAGSWRGHGESHRAPTPTLTSLLVTGGGYYPQDPQERSFSPFLHGLPTPEVTRWGPSTLHAWTQAPSAFSSSEGQTLKSGAWGEGLLSVGV